MDKVAFPITSTRRIDRFGPRAFSLIEVVISATLSGFILLAILTSFLMLGRTGASIQNYTDIEAQTRKALEYFSRETRSAFAVATGYSTSSVTLSIPDSSATRNALGYNVTYAYDSANSRFTRTGPPIDNPAGTSTTTTLISGVQQITGVNPFNYYRCISGTYSNSFPTNTASNISEIKQIEINFLVQRTSLTVTTATSKVLSACFILRNK
jgi:Tfp pilus assembly protein PilW